MDSCVTWEFVKVMAELHVFPGLYVPRVGPEQDEGFRRVAGCISHNLAPKRRLLAGSLITFSVKVEEDDLRIPYVSICLQVHDIVSTLDDLSFLAFPFPE